MTTERNAKEVLHEILGHISFGDFLYSERMAQDMSQVEFAKFLGISKQDLCDIEKGRKKVGLDRAKIFAEKLDYPPAVVFKYVFEDQLYRLGFDLEFELKAKKN